MQGAITSVIWRHYKRGGRYRIIAIVTDSDVGDALVVYQAADGTGPLWSRPAMRGDDGWFGLVEWPDGKLRTRFASEPALEKARVLTGMVDIWQQPQST